MDTLFWTKLNSEIRLKYTVKQYFGQYTWKLRLYVPGCRVILFDRDIGESIESRIALGRLYISNRLWHTRPPVFPNIKFLENLRSIKNKTKDITKVRIEEPYLTFYSEDENTLKEIVKSLMAFDLSSVIEISGPKDDGAKETLATGAIFVKTDIGFKYKVVLRNGSCDPLVKKQILGYLDNLDDQVKLNHSGRRLLSEPWNQLWGTFFYTNDKNIATILNLISPGIISNIHELVYNEG